MADYTPKPPVAQAGQPPLATQWVPYREENGDLKSAIMHAVNIPKDPTDKKDKGQSADGKYVNVSVSILDPAGPFHPGKVERNGRVYWRDLGIVTSDPCGPPYPG